MSSSYRRNLEPSRPEIQLSRRVVLAAVAFLVAIAVAYVIAAAVIPADLPLW